jgi:glycosyltransferase involved in cell wall biosynthesis
MRIQPDLLARAVLDEFRRCRMGADMFDAIDAHYFYPDGVAAARVANELRLPLVISARGSDINRVGEIRFARQRMLSAAKRAQALVAVSADLAKKMTEYGMPKDRVHVLRNGVDTKLFAPHPRAAARRKLGLCMDGSLVIGVGNCVPLKGFDLLIRAASPLQGVRLLIVGEGPLRDDLASLAEALMPGRIEFRPNMRQEELRYAYASADVLGLPSLSEGWPNVILEAIACGTPVVASSVGGVPEILSNDAPARLIPDRSVESWTDALRKILANPIAPAEVRQYAIRFGWDEIVKRQCGLYESVVAAHQGTIAIADDYRLSRC